MDVITNFSSDFKNVKYIMAGMSLQTNQTDDWSQKKSNFGAKIWGANFACVLFNFFLHLCPPTSHTHKRTDSFVPKRGFAPKESVSNQGWLNAKASVIVLSYDLVWTYYHFPYTNKRAWVMMDQLDNLACSPWSSSIPRQMNIWTKPHVRTV